LTSPNTPAKTRRFFFQAEDGIRDLIVTGVQTCALPICATLKTRLFYVVRTMLLLTNVLPLVLGLLLLTRIVDKYGTTDAGRIFEIGRASCRERVEMLSRATTSRRVSTSTDASLPLIMTS